MGSDPAARITSVLRANPRGIGITKIARIAGMHRAAAAKYLELLRASGHVEMRKEGMTKLYSLSHRVPITAMLDFQDDILVVLDDRGRVVQVNGRYEAICGIARERILGTAPTSSTLPIIGDPDVLAAIGALESPEVLVRSCRVPGEDGGRSYRIRLIPTVLDRGETGVTVIGVDITREREIGEQLLATETRYQSVIDLLPDLVCRFRPDYTITLTNRRFREWFGSHAEDPGNTLFANNSGGSRAGNNAGNHTRSPAGNHAGNPEAGTGRSNPEGTAGNNGITLTVSPHQATDQEGVPALRGAGQTDTCTGMNFLELVYGNDAGEVLTHLASLNGDAWPVVHEHAVFSRDGNGGGGRARWLRWHYQPEYDASGSLAKVQATGTDITGEKVLEETVNGREREIAFLSRKASELALLPTDADIWEAIAEGFLELVPGAVISHSSFDLPTRTLTVRAIVGDRNGVFKKEFSGSIGLAMPFPEPETLQTLSSGRLIPVPGGLHVVTFGRIPPMVCSRIERKIHWTSTYTIGLIGRDQPLSGIGILKCTPGPVERPDTLVAYCRVAALALQERIDRPTAP